jgi:hypothetical protein
MADTQTVTLTGDVNIGGTDYTLSLPVQLSVASGPVTPPPPPPPPPSGTVPYPSALAKGHTLLHEYLPGDLYAWCYQPGTTTPVVNGSGVSEDPSSPRNVSVTTDGGVSVLKLATTSTADCGVIQSPTKYPTDSGVIEALVKFSGFTNGDGHVFADWASFWMYGDDWPQQGEIDAVETQFGQSYVSYHYGTSDTEATTDPWAYSTKKVQLQPKTTSAVPAAPNIVPDEWCHVTLAFGKGEVDVYYEGVLYTKIAGSYVTGKPMYITAGTSFGAPVLGSDQAPYDQPGSVELQYIRVFS